MAHGRLGREAWGPQRPLSPALQATLISQRACTSVVVQTTPDARVRGFVSRSKWEQTISIASSEDTTQWEPPMQVIQATTQQINKVQSSSPTGEDFQQPPA